MNDGLKKIIMALSATGLIFIAMHEGYSPAPYLDGAKVATDGFGNTVNVVMGKARGMVQDLVNLLRNTQSAQDAVNRCIHVQMTQNQFDAMTDFAFNTGNKAFCNSTLAKRFNAGDKSACDEMLNWVWITRDGVKLDCRLPQNTKYCGGLVTRRQDERALCMEP